MLFVFRKCFTIHILLFFFLFSWKNSWNLEKKLLKKLISCSFLLFRTPQITNKKQKTGGWWMGGWDHGYRRRGGSREGIRSCPDGKSDATTKVEEHQNLLARAFIVIINQGRYSYLELTRVIHDIPNIIIRLGVNTRKTLYVYISLSISCIIFASVLLLCIVNL